MDLAGPLLAEARERTDARLAAWAERLRERIPGRDGEALAYALLSPGKRVRAALVIASGLLGRDPSPRAVEQHLKATATDLGPLGTDQRYGAGLINAAAATTPR